MALGKKANHANGAKLGFEATLWQAADALRGHMDASEYKHVLLGLIFLKYISDALTELYDQLKSVYTASLPPQNTALSGDQPEDSPSQVMNQMTSHAKKVMTVMAFKVLAAVSRDNLWLSQALLCLKTSMNQTITVKGTDKYQRSQLFMTPDAL